MEFRKLVTTEEQFPRTADVLGYHGTSVEAVSMLANTKRFPNSGISPERFCLVHPDCEMSHVLWFAHQIAVRHYLLGVLPFRVPSHLHALAVQSLVDEKLTAFRLGAYKEIYDECMRLARDSDMDEEDVRTTVENGYRDRKGCLLALSSQMRKDFRIVFDGSKIELALDPEKNHIDYVSAICPLGIYEQQEMQRLSV